MTTILTKSAPQTARQHRLADLLHELSTVIIRFIGAAVHPYRPEQHYMRGPGPACAARHTQDRPGL